MSLTKDSGTFAGALPLRRYLTVEGALGFMLFVGMGLAFSFIAALFTQEVSPHSAGSGNVFTPCFCSQQYLMSAGIPAMKSVLSGLILHHYLSMRCLLAKIGGLSLVVSVPTYLLLPSGTVFAIAGGLPIGKEGPYVHSSAMYVDDNSVVGSCHAHLQDRIPTRKNSHFFQNQECT